MILSTIFTPLFRLSIIIEFYLHVIIFYVKITKEHEIIRQGAFPRKKVSSPTHNKCMYEYPGERFPNIL